MPAKGDTKHVRKRVSDCVTTSAGLASVLNGMRADDVGQVATKDALILQLGQHLVTKCGADKEQQNYIRCKMRFLGRLLLHLRKKSGQMNSSLSDFINPSKFLMLKEVAKDCAGFSDETQEYDTPSQAIKCSQLLKKVAEIKESKALEVADITTAESCVQFSRLCHLQWSEISAVAHRNVAERKRNGVRYLPLTSDV